MEIIRGEFFNKFSHLQKSWHLGTKLAPTLVLDLALLVPRREVGAYVSFKILASELLGRSFKIRKYSNTRR
jgi:hypothetical protein